MKDDPFNNDLLNDCLAEVAPSEFREGLLDRMLQDVRLRRARRQRNRLLLIAVCVATAFGLIGYSPRKPSSPSLAGGIPLEVHSAPLEAAMLVGTRTGGFERAETSRAGLEVVATAPTKKLFAPIGDVELFAMLNGRPAVLIRHDALDAELVLVNPDDRAGFVVR